MLWLISIIVWAGSWFGIFISYAVYGGDSDQYNHLVQITIMDLVCTDFIAVIFTIMGLILFRSSQVAKQKHETLKANDISFDQFLDTKWVSNQPGYYSRTTS